MGIAWEAGAQGIGAAGNRRSVTLRACADGGGGAPGLCSNRLRQGIADPPGDVASRVAERPHPLLHPYCRLNLR